MAKHIKNFIAFSDKVHANKINKKLLSMLFFENVLDYQI